MKRYLKPVEREEIIKINEMAKVIDVDEKKVHRCQSCRKIAFQGDIGQGGKIKIKCSFCKLDLYYEKI